MRCKGRSVPALGGLVASNVVTAPAFNPSVALCGETVLFFFVLVVLDDADQTWLPQLNQAVIQIETVA